MGKEDESIEQIQAEHDERLLEHWSSISRYPKGDNCIHKSCPSCLKLPYDISQPVLRDIFSYSKLHAQERNISLTRFPALAFMPSANKVQKDKLKTNHQEQEMIIRKQQISDENKFLLMKRCVFPPS